MSAPERWTFRIDAFELGDTLRDVEAGRRFELALQLFPGELREVEEGERAARKIEWSRYAVTGVVAFAGERSWILDFGLPVVCAEADDVPSAGAILSGDVELASLTAGMWESALFEPPAPPLDCLWEVERVWVETGRSAPAFEEVARTDHAAQKSSTWYLLDCVRLRGPERR